MKRRAFPESQLHHLAPDEFPSSAADTDYALQILIASDLENSYRLESDFEANRPKQPKFMEDTAYELKNRPKPAMLYPNLFKSQPKEWLLPLSRRLLWHASKPDSRWIKPLSQMIHRTLENGSQLSEDEFCCLAPVIGRLDPIEQLLCSIHLPNLLEGLLSQGSTSDKVIGGLRILEELHRITHNGVHSSNPYWWQLFRVNGFLRSEAPWAAGVRADIGASDLGLLSLFNAQTASLEHVLNPSAQAREAMEEVGVERLEPALRRWIGLLMPSIPDLTEIDTRLLRHVIVLIDRLSAKAGDELLWDIARAPWYRGENVGWVKTFLWASKRFSTTNRSASRAFACVEALVMNPVTATEEVLDVYHSLLATMQTEGASKGVDGFPFESDSALASLQRRIDQVLRICAESVARGPNIEQNNPLLHMVPLLDEIESDPRKAAFKRLLDAQFAKSPDQFHPGPAVRADLETAQEGIYGVAEPFDLFRATFQRLDWITEHEQDFPKDVLIAWRQCLQGPNGAWGIRGWACRRLDALPLPWLLRALQSIPGELHLADLYRRHVAEHGWSAELVEAMRKWIKTIETSAASNLHRARIEWFLWFEDAAPIQLADCWSYRVKQDLRQMQPKECLAWLKLLENPSFTVTAKPPAKWMKSATAAFVGVGSTEFRRRFIEWFAPFLAETPLRLTVCGRNMLRCLIWLALVANDPLVDEALCRFAAAKWKTKEHVRCAAQAEMAFSFVLAERVPEGAEEILEQMLKTGRAAAGSATDKALQNLRSRSR